MSGITCINSLLNTPSFAVSLENNYPEHTLPIFLISISNFSEGSHFHMWLTYCRSLSKNWSLWFKEPDFHLTPNTIHPTISLPSLSSASPVLLLLSPQSFFLHRCWYLFGLFIILIGNSWCALLCQVDSSWFQGVNSQNPTSKFSRNATPIILLPRPDVFFLPLPPIFLGMFLDMEWYKRKS